MDVEIILAAVVGVTIWHAIKYVIITAISNYKAYKKDLKYISDGASKLKPKISPKTDFTEMCGSCFSSMISKMPLRTICDLKEVERQRMIGCSHNSKLTTAPPTTEYLKGNEPDFSVTSPEVDTRRTAG